MKINLMIKNTKHNFINLFLFLFFFYNRKRMKNLKYILFICLSNYLYTIYNFNHFLL